MREMNCFRSSNDHSHFLVHTAHKASEYDQSAFPAIQIIVILQIIEHHRKIRNQLHPKGRLWQSTNGAKITVHSFLINARVVQQHSSKQIWYFEIKHFRFKFRLFPYNFITVFEEVKPIQFRLLLRADQQIIFACHSGEQQFVLHFIFPRAGWSHPVGHSTLSSFQAIGVSSVPGHTSSHSCGSMANNRLTTSFMHWCCLGVIFKLPGFPRLHSQTMNSESMGKVILQVTIWWFPLKVFLVTCRDTLEHFVFNESKNGPGSFSQ